ncbi:DUF1980 domain-containing protein [Paenibacillus sacheonensis]|uniref:DUF1980 domain-containing protein n=1 Tax=Paenibacillus sacheonensis TaxID=742054 RepID=A0A7X4YQL8_9BACL|nr:DUF1980 domain-containing protein [Paenibacillus sacheonensis]MBM7567402.1 uncharacterized membrane protein YcgQ (UPF0703/DUF1980 family) [Paenibacillus sacheonensis]NBC69816.1 DUF1980 domain-containing protein [Paenibacillus sacheonensis]
MSTKQRTMIAHHLIRFCILGAFGFYIVYLARTGMLVRFVEPNLVVAVKLSAIGLFATAIYQLQAAVQEWHGIEAAACDCNHEPSKSFAANLFIYGLFALPLVLGFIS